VATNTNDVVYKRLSIKKASNDNSGICFFLLPYFIGCFSSSRVKPSPMTSCTDVIATKACGSTSSIIVFNFTISFLTTIQLRKLFGLPYMLPYIYYNDN